MNGLSVASSEEEFLRAAAECRRFGAAVIILALPRHEGGYPNYQEKAGEKWEKSEKWEKWLGVTAAMIFMDFPNVSKDEHP